MALASAFAWGIACSARKIGPSSTASESPHAPDGAYGGSFPVATAPARDDGDARAIDPAIDAYASDEDVTEADDVAIEDAASLLPDGACAQAPDAGALRIDELMIASVAGSGDNGEWFEIENALDCALNLNGLHGECPHGSKVTTFDVTDDVWIPPHGTFVVADSSDPAINHDVPGVVFASVRSLRRDVLRNQGTTITVSLNGTMLDTLTYPSLTLQVGDSLAFPEDCDPGERFDFTKWKRSTASWFPGFLGTPNAPNDDVMCP